ncbi:hypothetical protein ABZ413_29685 [Nocardia rhamnosiphila]|uniref:hypothetical protein n=1 Tax=Nocardia rhamnosiphila TaxID=426716 RepID=UPI003405F09D
MSWQAVKWATTDVPPGLVKLAPRAVLAVYAECANEHGLQSRPTYTKIAWRLGCTPRNVADHVKTLVAEGLLVRSPDQSAVAHLPKDKRPVVYDLPMSLVRTDTYEEFAEAESALRERYRKPKTKPDAEGPKTDPREAQSLNGMQNPSCPTGERHEENFQRGMKNPSPRHEENFPSGTKKTSCSSFPGTTQEPSVVPPTRAELEAAVDPLCERLRQRLEENGRVVNPTVTRLDRAACLGLLNTYTPKQLESMIVFATADKHWRPIATDMSAIGKHHKTIYARTVEASEKESAPAGLTNDDRKFKQTFERGSRLAQIADPAPPPGVRSITASSGFFPVQQLQPANETLNQEIQAA